MGLGGILGATAVPMDWMPGTALPALFTAWLPGRAWHNEWCTQQTLARKELSKSKPLGWASEAATCGLISSWGPPLQPDSLSLSPFPPLCPSPGLLPTTGGPYPSRAVRPPSYRGTSVALSPVAHSGQGLSSHCLTPACPLPGTAQHLGTCWRLSSPHTCPAPILGHVPFVGLTLVTPDLPGWTGELGGLTFLGTVMTMGSHLRSCSL